jgi:F-type H+-transporting ATPase subunit epsilon
LAKLRLEVVTAERLVFSGDVDAVIAPGTDGQLGILPHHMPLLALLSPGELRARQGDELVRFAVGGGFMEVLPDQVNVFADTAERAEEIDLARAEEARRRAEALLSRQTDTLEFARAEAALRRALVRIKVARDRRRSQRMPPESRSRM